MPTPPARSHALGHPWFPAGINQTPARWWILILLVVATGSGKTDMFMRLMHAIRWILTYAPLKPQARDMYYCFERKFVLMVRVENGLSCVLMDYICIWTTNGCTYITALSCTKHVWYSEHGTYYQFECILEWVMSATHVAVILRTRTSPAYEEEFTKMDYPDARNEYGTS